MLKKFIAPVFLILVAGLSWWYIKSLEKSLMPKPPAVSEGPDYFMFDAVSTVLNQSGKPEQQLHAAYLAHFADDNRTELEDAHLNLHQPDGSHWSVKANKGTLYKTTEQLFLSGQVVIERPQTVAPKSQEASTPATILQEGIKIETDKIHIDASRQIAETDDPVQITGREVRLNAVGMKANLQTKTVELLAKVRGTYASER